VGDGFTRTVTLRASETDPVVFPELVLPEASGMTAYPSGLRATTNTERGTFGGEESLRVTYVIDRVGPHEMPAFSVVWLEPRAGRYFEARVPAVKVWAYPNPALGFQCLGTARAAGVVTELVSVGTLALFAWALIQRRRRGPGRVALAWRERSRERRAFHGAVVAIQREPPFVGLQKIYAWLAIRFPRLPDRTLAPLEATSDEARTVCTGVESAVFGNGKSIPSPKAFVVMLRRARKAMGQARRPAVLESLNPAPRKPGGER